MRVEWLVPSTSYGELLRYTVPGQRHSSRKGEKQFLILENQGQEVVVGKLRPRKISEVETQNLASLLSSHIKYPTLASSYMPKATGRAGFARIR